MFTPEVAELPVWRIQVLESVWWVNSTEGRSMGL